MQITPFATILQLSTGNLPRSVQSFSDFQFYPKNAGIEVDIAILAYIRD